MKMTFDPEFKKALQMLPEKEKDKLILRLLKLNIPLAQRLFFELVDTDTPADKREEVKNHINRRVKRATEHYHSPGDLLQDLREISGLINDHVSVTKDKIGEISLHCQMLRSALELNNERIATAAKERSYTLHIYIIARVFKILMLIKKQHEDLYLEFKDDIKAIGMFIGSNHNLMSLAIHNGLDVNWLIGFKIPENIAEIHRDLRKNGFLR